MVLYHIPQSTPALGLFSSFLVLPCGALGPGPGALSAAVSALPTGSCGAWCPVSDGALPHAGPSSALQVAVARFPRGFLALLGHLPSRLPRPKPRVHPPALAPRYLRACQLPPPSTPALQCLPAWLPVRLGAAPLASQPAQLRFHPCGPFTSDQPCKMASL